MAKEFYILGDDSRLVVKNFKKELNSAEYVVQTVTPLPARVKKLPDDKPIHVVVFLTEDFNFECLRELAKKREVSGLHIYLVGSLGNIDLQDRMFFEKLPSSRFLSTATLSVEKLAKRAERNDIVKKRVLVVDDEPILLRNIKSWLGDEFEVSLVNSGSTALTFLASKEVDLVLLDFKMPEMDGAETLMRIRLNETFKDLPVIMLSAANDRESVMRSVKQKCDGYILKSETPDKIRQYVKDFFKNQIVVL